MPHTIEELKAMDAEFTNQIRDIYEFLESKPGLWFEMDEVNILTKKPCAGIVVLKFSETFSADGKQSTRKPFLYATVKVVSKMTYSDEYMCETDYYFTFNDKYEKPWKAEVEVTEKPKSKWKFW